MSERPPDEQQRDPERREATEDDPMEHRFAADEEVADEGAAGADEARTPGMGA